MTSRPASRPSVILFLSDDQGEWAMGCSGNRELHTPGLDRLAASGLRFDHFFCTSPVCSPARASLLTGRIPSRHGVHDWIRGGNTPGDHSGSGAPIEYLAGQSGYTDVLAQHGYACGLSGKWHLGNSLRPQKGHTFWEVHAGGGGPYYHAPMIRDGRVYDEPRYVTDAITDNAIGFLETQKAAAAPFYLGVHYTAPHSPWDREHHPAEIYDDYYRNCPFASVPRETPHPWQINSAPLGHTDEARRGVLSGYFAAITAMDRNVGRVLDWLERAGMRQNTLVIFTSDNGMNMGHHGLYGKGNASFPFNMFDTSVKVPMLISMPGCVPAGGVCHDLLSQYDVRPTLLDFAGLPDPGARQLPGRSFAPILRGQVPGGTDAPVVVYDEYGPVRMIRDRHWKYVHRYPQGPHELYSLADDPGETRNLYGQPGQEGRVEFLRASLGDWFARHVDPARDGAREGVTGRGQLCLAGVASRGQCTYADDWAYVSGQPREIARVPPS
ncbi:MAG: sulfatase-like hydrolase/transferase [bacterium]